MRVCLFLCARARFLPRSSPCSRYLAPYTLPFFASIRATVSTDGGATWSFVDLPPAVAQINAVSVAPDGSLWFSTLVGLWRGFLADSGDYRAASAPSVVWDVPLNSSTPNGTYIELYDVAWSG